MSLAHSGVPSGAARGLRSVDARLEVLWPLESVLESELFERSRLSITSSVMCSKLCSMCCTELFTSTSTWRGPEAQGVHTVLAADHAALRTT